MRFRIVGIVIALLLLAVVIGWFMAGKDRISTTGIEVADAPMSAPVAPAPRPVQPAVPSAPAAPVDQPSAPVPPPAASQPGPIIQPLQTTPPAPQSRPSVPPAMAGPRGASQGQAAGSAPPAPPSPEATEATVLALDKVNLMLRDFRTRMGSNPVGTNAEIMKAVMGDNPKGARLGPPEGQSLNGNGELVDMWGTPYFFHQMTATSMEIHSAGPDRTFGSSDDIIHR